MRNLMVAAGIGAAGGVADWGIFIGHEPDTPNNCIVIYDTPGDIPNPKWLLDFPRFQVRCRGLDYLETLGKAEAIKSLLLGLPSQDIGDTRYVGIYVTMDTFHLETDSKQRSIFVNSWRVIREPSVGINRRPL